MKRGYVAILSLCLAAALHAEDTVLPPGQRTMLTSQKIVQPEDTPFHPGNQRIKQFVLSRYPKLLRDVRQGQGPALDTLLGLQSIPVDSRPETVKQIQVLAQIYYEPADFADRMMDMDASARKDLQ